MPCSWGNPSHDARPRGRSLVQIARLGGGVEGCCEEEVLARDGVRAGDAHRGPGPGLARLARRQGDTGVPQAVVLHARARQRGDVHFSAAVKLEPTEQLPCVDLFFTGAPRGQPRRGAGGGRARVSVQSREALVECMPSRTVEDATRAQACSQAVSQRPVTGFVPSKRTSASWRSNRLSALTRSTR